MSYADCDFSGDGDEGNGHLGCCKMTGHIGPHRDCAGREWWTDEKARFYWESLTEEQRNSFPSCANV